MRTKGRGKTRSDVESEGRSSTDRQSADSDPAWVSEETWTIVDKEVDAD